MNRAEPYLRWLPSLIWAATILLSSGQVGGSDRTATLLHWLLPAGTAPETFALFHAIFRKSGHLIAYGLLGGLNSYAMRGRRPVLAVLLAIAVAVVDEWHQSFVPIRTGTPYDVLLDAAGASLAVGVKSLCRRGRGPAPPAADSGYDVAP